MGDNMSVVKCFSFPESYTLKIKEGAKKLGISESELIRRAVDDYLAKFGLMVVTDSELEK